MLLGHQQDGICQEYRGRGKQMSQRHGSRWRWSRFLCRIHGQMENHVKKKNATTLLLPFDGKTFK